MESGCPPLRYSDVDTPGHINNVAIAGLYQEARWRVLQETNIATPWKGVVVRQTIDYLGEIRHPAVRGVLKDLKIDDGMEIHHHGDLPARSGLGSSSSFTVGLLNALHAFNGQMRTNRELASEADTVQQPKWLFREETFALVVEMLASEEEPMVLGDGIMALGHLYNEPGIPVIARSESRRTVISHG